MRPNQAVLAFLVVLGAAAPTTQGQASGTVLLEVAADHPVASLDPNGRGQAGLVVKATMRDTRCLDDAQVRAGFHLAPFPKWAGASPAPPDVAFHVAPLQERPVHPVAYARLEVAWDIESVPRGRATHEYTISLAHARMDGGPCVWPPRFVYGAPATITISFDARQPLDRPTMATTTTPPAQPSLPAADEPVEFVPGASAWLAMLALVAALRGRRTRT